MNYVNPVKLKLKKLENNLTSKNSQDRILKINNW